MTLPILNSLIRSWKMHSLQYFPTLNVSCSSILSKHIYWVAPISTSSTTSLLLRWVVIWIKPGFVGELVASIVPNNQSYCWGFTLLFIWWVIGFSFNLSFLEHADTWEGHYRWNTYDGFQIFLPSLSWRQCALIWFITFEWGPLYSSLCQMVWAPCCHCHHCPFSPLGS